MVIVVPLQVTPRLRVSLCQVICVPAVVIASVAVRVSVSAAVGYSDVPMFAIAVWLSAIKSYTLAVELDTNHLISGRFPLETDAVDILRNGGIVPVHTNFVSKKIVAAVAHL